MAGDSERIVQHLGRVLRRQRLVILAAAGAVLGLTLVLNAVLDPVYEAATTLVFDEPLEPVPGGKPVVLSQEILLTNWLEELRSFSFSGEVAGRLPPNLQARVPVPQRLPPGFDRARAVATGVQAAIKPFPIPKSNIVRIVVWTPDPELSAAIADTAASVFCLRRVRFRNAGESDLRRFIENQVLRYQAQLGRSEQELRDYKERQRITTYTDDAREILRRSTEAEVLLNAAATNRQSVVERLAAVEAKLAEKRGGLVPAMTAAGNPMMQKLQDKLVDLQSQHMELKVRDYAPDHPKMIDLQKQIQDTERSLVQETQKIAATAEVGDPLAQLEKYSTEAVELRIQTASLAAQEAGLRRILDDYERSLARLPSKEQELTRLTRERDVNEKLYTALLEKLEQTRISEAERIPGFRLLDVAQRPIAPIRPRKALNLALGLVAGLLVGGAIGFVREGVRPTMDSSLEVEKLTGWRVLASIPKIPLPAASASAGAVPPRDKALHRRASRALVAASAPNSAAAEAYRMLRTNLQFAGLGGTTRTLLVTSAGPGDGKSNTVANLAIMSAGMGGRTLLVDAETRKVGVDALFGLGTAPGLTDLLALPGGATTEAIARAIHSTDIQNLDLLPSGTLTPNPGDSLSADPERLRELLAKLQHDYHLVLLDSPPLLLVHETLLLASMVDGVLFVINSARPDGDGLVEARGALAAAGARVLGVALNAVEPVGIYRHNSYYQPSAGVA